jgi:transcriptional regulator with XRE-family HTH domain
MSAASVAAGPTTRRSCIVPEVTRRELMKQAAGLGAVTLVSGTTGLPDLTPAEAATAGDGRMGARIRIHRKRLGLSQEIVAHRVGKSRRWLQKVEAGQLLVAKLHDVIGLADVLHLQPSELVDRPVPIAAPAVAGEALVAPLRAVLLSAPCGGRPAASVEPSRVRAAFELACRLHEGRRHAELAQVLPGLVVGAEQRLSHARDDREVEAASWLLVNVHCMTSALCQRLGDPGLAWVAVTLADRVAGRQSLSLQQAVVARRVVNLLLHEGRYGEAGDGAMAAAEKLAGSPESPEQLSAQGFLLLKGAVTAARLDDAATAWQVLGEAGRVADRLGSRDANHLWTAFGPANVELHGLDLALNLGDPREALRRADRLDPGRLAVAERAARYWIDVSRAYTAESRRDAAAAVSALLEAERIDPWEVRHQAVVRVVVRVLLHGERRSATPGLRGLAERVGVLASA